MAENVDNVGKENVENANENIEEKHLKEEVQKNNEEPEAEANSVAETEKPENDQAEVSKVEESLNDKASEESSVESTEDSVSNPEEEKESESSEEEEEKAIDDQKEIDKKEPVEEADDGHSDESLENDSEEELPPLNVDYSDFTKEEMLDSLRALIEKRDISVAKVEIERLKGFFYTLYNKEIDNKKAKFLEDGGEEQAFTPVPDPIEEDFKALYQVFRNQRSVLNRSIEEEKGLNLEKKKEIIEKISNLANTKESLNKTFNEFRDLQREWREIGLVPQSEVKALWNTYHYAVEKFYDYVKINRELRDLDLKKNLEQKITLCEKAEELLLESSIVKAFKQLQKYHNDWREIGPVPREQKDELWNRFKEATRKINKSHQDYFEKLKEEQKNNLIAKTHLCEKVEEIIKEDIENHKIWDAKSKEIVELQKIWRTIGFAPKKDNNKIYQRFRTACDDFFDRKRDFYSQNKEIQDNNYQLKQDLCLQAESMIESNDWKKTTTDFINIQKKWKEIGPVPRKQSEEIWQRFRTACDAFFKRKSEYFSSIDEVYEENLKLKTALIEKVEKYKFQDDENEDLKNIKAFQKEYTEIGHVPFKQKDEIRDRFRNAINELFDKIDLDDSKRKMIQYRQKLDNYNSSPKSDMRLNAEREKLINKLKQIENDIVLWENNIGFFAKSKNSEALLKDVRKKIEDGKKKIIELREKIRMIDKI